MGISLLKTFVWAQLVFGRSLVTYTPVSHNSRGEILLYDVQIYSDEPLGVTFGSNFVVNKFARGSSKLNQHSISLAEQSGKVLPGDQLLSINGIEVGPLDFGKFRDLARRAAPPRTYRFSRQPKMQDGDDKADLKPKFRVWHSNEHDRSRKSNVPAMSAAMEPAVFSARFAPGHRYNTYALAAGQTCTPISSKVSRNSHPLAWADPPEACDKLNQQVNVAVVVARRGLCSFDRKVQNIVASGGAAVLVVNSDSSTFAMKPPPSNPDFASDVPVAMISREWSWNFCCLRAILNANQSPRTRSARNKRRLASPNWSVPNGPNATPTSVPPQPEQPIDPSSIARELHSRRVGHTEVKALQARVRALTAYALAQVGSGDLVLWMRDKSGVHAHSVHFLRAEFGQPLLRSRQLSANEGGISAQAVFVRDVDGSVSRLGRQRLLRLPVNKKLCRASQALAEEVQSFRAEGEQGVWVLLSLAHGQCELVQQLQTVARAGADGIIVRGEGRYLFRLTTDPPSDGEAPNVPVILISQTASAMVDGPHVNQVEMELLAQPQHEQSWSELLDASAQQEWPSHPRDRKRLLKRLQKRFRGSHEQLQLLRQLHEEL